ncbi:hypothetical protein CDD83_10406 [Cordyceps sp. RAO-2017]|nr:hypothetical protein CDD83_10406 [Cordyceps sp. RAO-2017]
MGPGRGAQQVGADSLRGASRGLSFRSERSTALLRPGLILSDIQSGRGAFVSARSDWLRIGASSCLRRAELSTLSAAARAATCRLTASRRRLFSLPRMDSRPQLSVRSTAAAFRHYRHEIRSATIKSAPPAHTPSTDP